MVLDVYMPPATVHPVGATGAREGAERMTTQRVGTVAITVRVCPIRYHDRAHDRANDPDPDPDPDRARDPDPDHDHDPDHDTDPDRKLPT